MITLRRSTERSHIQRGDNAIWLTFSPRASPGPPLAGIGALIALDEKRIPPGGVSAAQTPEEGEIVTYLYRGALAQEGSTGSSGVIHTGEFQRMSVGHGTRLKEANASRTDWAHVFRICLRPTEAGLEQAMEQKRFTAAQRRGLLCVVASPDARRGSLRVRQDALVYSSILEPGHHLSHELLAERSAWLHIVHGEATLNDIVLAQGDGVGFANELSVSLTVQEDTEILLIDLGPA